MPTISPTTLPGLQILQQQQPQLAPQYYSQQNQQQQPSPAPHAEEVRPTRHTIINDPRFANRRY